MKDITLIHGFPDGPFIFSDLSQKLASFANCHLYALPGYGGDSNFCIAKNSPIKPWIQMLNKVADDISEFSTRNHLIGHDWGGVLCFYMAALYPDLVESITIINAPHPTKFKNLLASNLTQKKMSSYIDFFKTQNAADILKKDHFRELKKIIAGNVDRKPHLMQSYTKSVDNMLDYYRLFNFMEMEDLPFIRARTNIIWGINDKFLCEENLSSLHSFCNVDRIVKVNCGHWVFIEDPENVLKHIMDFLG